MPCTSNISKAEPDKKLVGTWTVTKSTGVSAQLAYTKLTLDAPAVKGKVRLNVPWNELTRDEQAEVAKHVRLFFAEVDGQPCGAVWMTPISVGGIDGYMLGPLATHPDFRKRGAGKLLAREVTRLALERGEGEYVMLVGDRDYYCPLGWVPTVPGAVAFPGPVDPTRVLVYSLDPSLAARLAGPIRAFGARPRS